jgi:nucleoside-diphosphate-sugar epimerase
MRIFLAGASGAVGRRLTPLLLRAGHHITGTTRSAETGKALAKAGVEPAVLDVLDGAAVSAALVAARPEIVIDQLTDLPKQFDEARIAEALPANARLYTEGTRHLIAGAQAAGSRRFIAQSYGCTYRPGGEPHPETDSLNLADPARGVVIAGVADMERQLLPAIDIAAIILRFGLLYGPGTWSATATTKPALHIDAGAHAALLAVTRGRAGIYNIADDGVISIAKARRELGFDPAFRLGLSGTCATPGSSGSTYPTPGCRSPCSPGSPALACRALPSRRSGTSSSASRAARRIPSRPASACARSRNRRG